MLSAAGGMVLRDSSEENYKCGKGGENKQICLPSYWTRNGCCVTQPWQIISIWSVSLSSMGNGMPRCYKETQHLLSIHQFKSYLTMKPIFANNTLNHGIIICLQMKSCHHPRSLWEPIPVLPCRDTVVYMYNKSHGNYHHIYSHYFPGLYPRRELRMTMRMKGDYSYRREFTGLMTQLRIATITSEQSRIGIR